MRKSKLKLAAVIIGLFSFYSISEEYLSTDIAKGFNWRYEKVAAVSSSSSTIIIDYIIDSVWGNPADTLFFEVTERDSVNEKKFSIDTTYTPVPIDTIYTQISHIICRKSNRITKCDSFDVSNVFRDYANAKHDTIDSYYNRSFSHPIEIDCNGEKYDGLKIGYYASGVGTHMGSSKDTTTFCNIIGLLSETYVHNGLYLGESDSFTITLLSYNGKDISYNCGVKTICDGKSSYSTSKANYKTSIGRTSRYTGFNLLGQLELSGKSVYGMRIARLSVKK